MPLGESWKETFSHTVLCPYAGVHQSVSDHGARPARETLWDRLYVLLHISCRIRAACCFRFPFPEVSQEFGREKPSGLAYSLMVDGLGNLRTGVDHRHQLKKILENPLDCKEIKLVSPKGYQPWMFIGRMEAEAESPIFWPPDVKSWLIGKDPDAEKNWRQMRRGHLRGWDGWMALLTQQKWVWASSGRWWWTGKPGAVQFIGSGGTDAEAEATGLGGGREV